MLKEILMPTWGLAMEEGTVTKWLVEPGAKITPGADLVEIETTKIANVMEATDGGILCRILVQPGETRACGDLLAVLADDVTADAEIDAFIKGFTPVAPAAREDAGSQVPEPTLLDLPAGPIRYLQQGDIGTPVVLIHGFGGDLDSWMFNQPDLAKDHRVVAFDLPGHGGSPKDVGPGGIDDLAATIADAIAKLDLADFHLVGHSLGGAVAVKLAAQLPQRCRSLSLIAPAGLSERIDSDYISDFIAATRSREIQRCLARLFADPTVVTREMAEAVARYKRLDGVEEALRKIEQACFPDGRQHIDLGDVLASLACPVQAIWGTEDQIISPATMKELPPAVEKHLIEEAGHMPQMEQPRRINDLLLAHFTKADRGWEAL
jgi:pyruvate dehydrogenase E2 component (dihydrolipoamide acetyltransferase)